MMGLKEAATTCWNKYGDFDGRAGRSEYWWWVLFTLLVQSVAAIVLGLGIWLFWNFGFLTWLFILIFSIILLSLILPTLAVSVRRLHDRDLSGWWYFLGFVPVGSIVLIVWFVLPGTSSPNKYGASA
ncbi:MAG: DUF805 domain-containing protein [Candidatus Nanopelagicales bacterium]